MVALRGVFALLFGIAALAWPGLTLFVLVYLFGIYAILDGITALAVGVSGKLWGLVALGVLGILAGIVAFVWPGMTAGVLLILIAAWAIVTGILEIVAAIQLRKAIENEWALGIGGALSVILGVILAADPLAGALALVWVIGLYAILFGVLLLWLAWRLHGYLPRAGEPHSGLA
jgi:uncharacterized membrane protein HdeD (DUF308 family)